MFLYRLLRSYMVSAISPLHDVITLADGAIEANDLLVHYLALQHDQGSTSTQDNVSRKELCLVPIQWSADLW